MGSTRFWSVPYSQVSGALSGSLNKLAVKGNVVSPDSALFEVKNNTGQTVFAVYNEGVRVYVDDGKIKKYHKRWICDRRFWRCKKSIPEFINDLS